MGPPDRQPPIVAFRRPEGATVRWQARVNVPHGVFRLYLTDAEVRHSLVAELPATMYQQVYQFRGLETRGEVVDLCLAFVGHDGREFELAVLVARLVNLGSNDSVSLSPPSRTAALVPQDVELRSGGVSPRGAEGRRMTLRAWRAPPPTPPPEAV